MRIGSIQTKHRGALGWAELKMFLLLLMNLLLKAVAQRECTTYASDLYACFPYVQNGNKTQVAADCCSPLQNIVETRPDCICTIQNLTAAVPNINLTRAYQLNALCKIQSTATLSSCNGTTAVAPSINKNSAYLSWKIPNWSIFFVGMIIFLNNFS
ncbi:hypothetical protein KP509_09G058500 [Ceratopteris richardii]|uniref:Bifunctional inhibitor/plant lipid transfer protein/seed storage helical domain-containing protein n=1 Tax=Ceratopteris richardii TaxID=49495 RepID=A0A8T2UAT4_CERRI|nr:hypothetical protein KP509_09G058500 [Ceratopteris richardii]